MVTASRISKVTGTDIEVVLAADPQMWMIRLAQALILQEDESKAEAARHKQR